MIIAITIVWLYMLTGLAVSCFAFEQDKNATGFDLRRVIVFWPWYLVKMLVKLVVAKVKS